MGLNKLKLIIQRNSKEDVKKPCASVLKAFSSSVRLSDPVRRNMAGLEQVLPLESREQTSVVGKV